MSQQYRGCPTFVTSAGASMMISAAVKRGTLVAVQVNFSSPVSGYVSLMDNNASTMVSGTKLFECTMHSNSTVLNYNFLPPIPVAYTAGLFVNTSNSQSVIVNYLPFMRVVP